MTELTADLLEPLVGDTFGHRELPLGLRLHAVRRLTAQPGAPRPAPFALELRAPASAPLDQRIHPLAHDALGEVDVFLVPIGPDGDELRYEAVFN